MIVSVVLLTGWPSSRCQPAKAPQDRSHSLRGSPPADKGSHRLPQTRPRLRCANGAGPTAHLCILPSVEVLLQITRWGQEHPQATDRPPRPTGHGKTDHLPQTGSLFYRPSSLEKLVAYGRMIGVASSKQPAGEATRKETGPCAIFWLFDC